MFLKENLSMLFSVPRLHVIFWAKSTAPEPEESRQSTTKSPTPNWPSKTEIKRSKA